MDNGQKKHQHELRRKARRKLCRKVGGAWKEGGMTMGAHHHAPDVGRMAEYYKLLEAKERRNERRAKSRGQLLGKEIV